MKFENWIALKFILEDKKRFEKHGKKQYHDSFIKSIGYVLELGSFF